MLKNRWGEVPCSSYVSVPIGNTMRISLVRMKVTFQIASLDDREVVAEDDELLIITCPDPPSLKKTVAICEKAAEMVGMPTPPLTFYSAVCAPPVTLPTLTN
eukprot:4703867-Pyramimonas_sp.AAC.1